jgi:hypothetical protein
MRKSPCMNPLWMMRSASWLRRESSASLWSAGPNGAAAGGAGRGTAAGRSGPTGQPGAPLSDAVRGHNPGTGRVVAFRWRHPVFDRKAW